MGKIAVSILAGASILSVCVNVYVSPSCQPKSNEPVQTVENQSKDELTTQEPSQMPTKVVIEVPTDKPTETPTKEPSPTPVIVMATPQTDDKIDMKRVKNESKKIVPNTIKTKNNGDNKSSNSTSDNSNGKKEDANTSNEANAAENTEDNSVQCKLSVKSSGKLILETDEEVPETDATVNIVCDSETENGSTCLSYYYSDLVNQGNNENEPTSYIPITSGVHIINFVNCNIDNLNFYLDTSTEEEKDSEPSHLSCNNYNTIPSQDVVDMEITSNDSGKCISVTADKTFSPLFQYYSKVGNEINANLRILDAEKNELQTLNLMEEEEEAIGSFTFEEGEQYYLEFNIEDEEVNMEIFCLKITENEE